ncbi:MAG: hydrolase Nlp/P60 [Flavobacterium sp. BFFFF2]|nr:MAG: hydrolase Nlp/P60 [Flavobacterium sp. BFFFF2]
MFGICLLANIPLRADHSDRSEMVSQVLYGETFTVLESFENWVKIGLTDDDYSGWIDRKQMQSLSEQQLLDLKQEPQVYSYDLLEYITGPSDFLMPIPFGSSLSFLTNSEINTQHWQFEGTRMSGTKDRTQLIQCAFMYLHAPYLWGGKTPMGIDCSGFTQMVYKLSGYALQRDASQQAQQGIPLSFIEESEPGDLAFFDNEEGKIIHVGIILANNYIIHASGKVRIDRLDHLGIFNGEVNRHTHRLRVIKKIL